MIISTYDVFSRFSSLARELGQPFLVGLDGLKLGLSLQVLLGRHQEKRHLAALGARSADVLLEAFALAPRAEAFWFCWERWRAHPRAGGGGCIGEMGVCKRARE